MNNSLWQAIDNFADSLVSEGKAISSVKHALIYVKGFLCTSQVTDLSQVKTEMVLNYLTQLEGRSQARVNQAIWALRLFIKWANVPGVDFPMQKRPNKTLRPLTDKEVEKIDHELYMHTLEPMYVRRFALKLMFYTGLRVKDIMTLTREDFQFKDESGESQSILEITKDGLNRKVTIPSDYSTDLQHYFRWWYEEKNAFNVSVANMNYMCRFLNQYNLLGDGRKITPELYRASFACRCLEQGMSLQELKRLMGHRSIRSARRYLKQMTKDNVSCINEEKVADTTKDKINSNSIGI